MSAAPPLTRVSLLLRLRDPKDNEAWSEFTRLYATVIYGFARKRGLQDADAADMMQDVLRSVSSAIGRLEYDSKKGTFRGWLYSITRNKIYNFLESRSKKARGTGDDNARQRLEEVPAKIDEDDWDREYERKAFAIAADRVKGEFQAATWQAFWKTAVEGIGAQEVGKELKMSPGAVYVAKSRVLARLKEEVETLKREE
jgi:RNA polymerase sigma factor (sigma-70 family)